MIEIKRFRTNSPSDGIPEALEYSQKNKCDIELEIGLSGVGEIVLHISGKETIEILHLRLKDAIDYVYQKFKSESMAGPPANRGFLKDGSEIANTRLGTHVVKEPGDK